MNNICVVFCTCPDGQVAEKLAALLLEQRMAACVNIIPEIRSIYRWNGEISRDCEVLMVIKTAVKDYAALESCLREHHPYDVPEVVALPVQAGLPEYLAWVAEETRK
jgi:periplasmic divalent cation tolerance protein